MEVTSKRPILLTGVGTGRSNIGRLIAERLLLEGEPVRTLVHHDDSRFDDLRALGAEVVEGDLLRPADVQPALRGVGRALFNMSLSTDYLEATATFASVAEAQGELELLVNVSQMTVSQMTATSSEESHQQRLHWLSELMLRWSGLPVTELRPTVFLDNPIFTVLPRQSISRGLLALPIGSGRTSPVAATDVAAVAATVLAAPAGHAGAVYELTGPASLDIDELAAAYGRAIGVPLTGVDIPQSVLETQLSQTPGLSPHTLQHILTVAELHRAGRYDRLTDDVERITGHRPQSVEEYLIHNREAFFGAS